MSTDYETDDEITDYSMSDTADEEEEEQMRYQILDPYVVEPEMREKIEEVMALGISSGAARVLLRKFQWDVEFLEERFYEKPNARTFLESKSIGCPKNPLDFDPCDLIDHKTCESCGDDVITKLCAACRFCESCWRPRLLEKINNGECEIQCEECGSFVEDEKILDIFATSPDVIAKFEKSILKSYVASNPLLTKCPNELCDKIVKVPHKGRHLVKCSCDTIFCHQCSAPPHPPIPCNLLKRALSEKVPYFPPTNEDEAIKIVKLSKLRDEYKDIMVEIANDDDVMKMRANRYPTTWELLKTSRQIVKNSITYLSFLNSDDGGTLLLENKKNSLRNAAEKLFELLDDDDVTEEAIDEQCKLVELYQTSLLGQCADMENTFVFSD